MAKNQEIVKWPSDEEVGGQAVLGRQACHTTPWLTERHGYSDFFIEENALFATDLDI